MSVCNHSLPLTPPLFSFCFFFIISGYFAHLRYVSHSAPDGLTCQTEVEKQKGGGAVLVALKDEWVASIRREDPMSVLVRVTLINHILSAGCVED